MKLEYIIIHHSQSPDGLALDWQAIRRFHTSPPPGGRGWARVGYQYGIELIGDRYEILKGRMDDEVGAHAKGFNDRSIGICCVGNFDQQVMPAEQLSLLLTLTKSLMAIHGIAASNVLGHRETYAALGEPISKTCPGDRVDMVKLREMLK